MNASMPISGSGGSRTEAGFTLIELLVSLAILAMCSTLLLGGLASASIVARQTRGQERTGADVTAAQIFLRSRLEAMQPVRLLNASDARIDANGSERVFDFVGPAQDSEAGTGLRRYRLLMTAPGDLILYHSPELASDIDRNAPSMTGWRRIMLLRHAAGLSIGYFGATTADPKRTWRTLWDQGSTMPAAIRIRIDFPAGDARVWPELIVRPASTLDVSCNPESANSKCGGR